MLQRVHNHNNFKKEKDFHRHRQVVYMCVCVCVCLSTVLSYLRSFVNMTAFSTFWQYIFFSFLLFTLFTPTDTFFFLLFYTLCLGYGYGFGRSGRPYSGVHAIAGDDGHLRYPDANASRSRTRTNLVVHSANESTRFRCEFCL